MGVALTIVGQAESQPASAQGYETGYGQLLKLTRELHNALDAKRRNAVAPEPALLSDVATPYLQARAGAPETADKGGVCLSPAFVEFMNRYAHARALDEVERGFSKRFLQGLSQDPTGAALNNLNGKARQEAWSFDTMNHQMSSFNQVAGSLIAVQMAHLYLGHYKKYAAQLAHSPNPTVAINSFVTPSEWRDAVLVGARNALDCGLGVEGLITFYEGFEKLPNRPEWVAPWLPKGIEVSKLRKDLEKLEKKFFAGEP
jgi:hypothetical protein